MIVRGNTEFWNCTCHRARDHAVYGMQIHEQFKEVKEDKFHSIYEHDIGVITVIEEFRGLYETAKDYTESSKYWHYSLADFSLTCFGWGHRKSTGIVQQQLRDASIVRDSPENCVRDHGKRVKNMPGVFCAKYYDNNNQFTSGPCPLDEGGPLLGIYDHSQYILIGVIVNAQSCQGGTSLFTNITYYQNWIADYVQGDTNPDSWYR
ncbi:hypothetical protein ILUMI_05760 [Ignelater luminosus]|uniref:Peptidase S1 domain-containing protein n=1 Tax=Ignelater luminosus TaxID=2038154 RepID=A0A8K0DBN4_IGNLU|nr:hypothetical protein ILUMI_05760 [Ignelater luminosus]